MRLATTVRIALRCVLAVLLASLPAPVPVMAQSDEQQTQQQLEQLQGKIQQLNRELSSAKTRRDKLRAEVKEAELALGKLQGQVRQTRAEIATAENKLTALQTQQEQLETRRQEQQARIANELETAWKMGRQEQIKVLLNQESPHTVARALAYYRYFFEARSELIEQFRVTLEQLKTVQAGIETTRQQLAGRQTELERQSAQLEANREARKQAVASLAANIAEKGDELQQLEQDQKKLEELLATIRAAVLDMNVPDDYRSFAEAKGKMPWPVAGKPSNQFGRARNAGKMRWQGVNIPAKEGTAVRAIHNGRVVYADWFRGSGLLLIIDHGDGYMSLYAHNQSLVREVGEWVKAGTAVGAVGASGGLEQPAVYFEIRHNGKPTNPASWCKG